MYAIGTYNHDEFLSNILAPKLIADLFNRLILCLRKDSVLDHAINFPYITKFWFLKCPMVICTLYDTFLDSLGS